MGQVIRKAIRNLSYEQQTQSQYSNDFFLSVIRFLKRKTTKYRPTYSLRTFGNFGLTYNLLVQ